MQLPTALLLPLLALPPFQEGAEPPTDDGSGGGLFGGNFLVPMVAIMAIFYFVLILPEKKQRKKREELLGSLKKGDKVITSSGIHATVGQVQDDIVTLVVADGVRIRFSRAAVQHVETGD
jgi:preprotein translocase subunit YajC